MKHEAPRASEEPEPTACRQPLLGALTAHLQVRRRVLCFAGPASSCRAPGLQCSSGQPQRGVSTMQRPREVQRMAEDGCAAYAWFAKHRRWSTQLCLVTLAAPHPRFHRQTPTLTSFMKHEANACSLIYICHGILLHSEQPLSTLNL